jgi:hypothetical protein
LIITNDQNVVLGWRKVSQMGGKNISR